MIFSKKIELGFVSVCAFLMLFLSACGEDSGSNSGSRSNQSVSKIDDLELANGEAVYCDDEMEGVVAITTDGGYRKCVDGEWIKIRKSEALEADSILGQEDEIDAVSSSSQRISSSSGVTTSYDDEDSSSSESSDEAKISSANLLEYAVDSVDDLPQCTAKREGFTAEVEENGKKYICDDGEWISLKVEKSSSSVKSSSSAKSSSSESSSFSEISSSSENETVKSSSSKNKEDSDVHEYSSSSKSDAIYRCEDGTYVVDDANCFTDVPVVEPRSATIDDLEKNMVFKGLFGTDVYLATGSKQGLFSLWIPDTAWVAVRSEFKDGVLEIKSNNSAIEAINGKGPVDSIKTLVKDGAKISFVVRGEQLQYSIDGGAYADVEKAQVRVPSSVISSSESLTNKRMTCEDGDTTRVYSFYEGRYLLENKVGDKPASWAAGYADIQRNYLLMVPSFFNAPASAIQTASVTSDYNMNFTNGKELKCDLESFSFESVTTENMAQKWTATDDGLDWTLELKAGKEFRLSAQNSMNIEVLSLGTWDVYGNVLLLQNQACLDVNCSIGYAGFIENYGEDSFEFLYSGEVFPSLPIKWFSPLHVGEESSSSHNDVVESSSGVEGISSSSAALIIESSSSFAATESSGSAITIGSSGSVITIVVGSNAGSTYDMAANKLTDLRDDQEYPTVTVDTLVWMNANLNYGTQSGSYCETAEGVNMCAKYGRYYSYSAALRACPADWRLPTLEEIQALDAVMDHEWWPIGGRFKIEENGVATEYGLEDEQAYYWIQDDGTYNSWRIENYSDKIEHEAQRGYDRAYNVRCVRAIPLCARNIEMETYEVTLATNGAYGLDLTTGQAFSSDAISGGSHVDLTIEKMNDDVVVTGQNGTAFSLITNGDDNLNYNDDWERGCYPEVEKGVAYTSDFKYSSIRKPSIEMLLTDNETSFFVARTAAFNESTGEGFFAFVLTEYMEMANKDFALKFKVYKVKE